MILYTQGLDFDLFYFILILKGQDGFEGNKLFNHVLIYCIIEISISCNIFKWTKKTSTSFPILLLFI